MTELAGVHTSRRLLTFFCVGLVAVGAVAIVALVVALSRSGSGSSPTYTAAQKAEAKTKLCDQYTLAGRAMHIETNPDGDVALARIAMTNGALILENAADDPALDLKYHDAALALASTYRTMAATGSIGDAQKFRVAVDDTNAKDRVMEGLCGD